MKLYSLIECERDSEMFRSDSEAEIESEFTDLETDLLMVSPHTKDDRKELPGIMSLQNRLTPPFARSEFGKTEISGSTSNVPLNRLAVTINRSKLGGRASTLLG